jgi:hypothetical protein
MVNNMTNYLSSISGAVNKLIDFNIDNVNDGFIDPENNGNGGDDDDDAISPLCTTYRPSSVFLLHADNIIVRAHHIRKLAL